MKVTKAVLLTVAAMAATSVVVWTATGPAQGSRTEPRAPATEPPAEPDTDPKAPDRSSFSAGGTLMMEGRLGHAVLPAASDSQTFVSVSVTADASKQAAERAKLTLAIVIDRSGSMKGKRLSNALDAARAAIGELRDGDVVSVLAYNTANEIIVPATELTAETRNAVTAELASIRARGDTCISCGINGAMRLLGSAEGSVSRILLLSDGLPTAGVRDEAGFRRIAEQCRAMGVEVTTIGVDIDYNEQIMASIARESNGRHFFVQDPSGLAPIFEQEMETLAKTIATNAELSIELSDRVFVDKIFDRSFERRGNTVVVPMGTFAAADKKSLLIRLRVPRGPAGERPIAAVKLSYNDLAGEKQGWCEGELIARASADPGEASEIDGLVQARVSRNETAEALSEATARFRDGDRAGAREVIRARRAKIAAEKANAARSAPTGRTGEVDFDFAAQGQALGGADRGYEAGAGDEEGSIQNKTNTADEVIFRQ